MKAKIREMNAKIETTRQLNDPLKYTTNTSALTQSGPSQTNADVDMLKDIPASQLKDLELDVVSFGQQQQQAPVTSMTTTTTTISISSLYVQDSQDVQSSPPRSPRLPPPLTDDEIMETQASGESSNDIKEDNRSEKRPFKKKGKAEALKIQKTSDSVKKRVSRKPKPKQ